MSISHRHPTLLLTAVLLLGLGPPQPAGGSGSPPGHPSAVALERVPAQEQEVDIRGSYLRSYEYERTQDYENAIRALSPVYEAYPSGYTVNLRMGWLFYLNGNFTNAVAHYEAASSAAPSALEPKLGRLLPLMAQGRWDSTEALAYQVVSVDHYSYYGNLRLGIALRMQGKLDAAYQVILKMATAYPTDTLFLQELARLAVARGDEDEAARLYTDVLILDPENQEARTYLGG
jgi:tetratricopeptide (TPR) repeat protein